MLTHPTLELLHELGLHGMARGFKALGDNPEAPAADFADCERRFHPMVSARFM